MHRRQDNIPETGYNPANMVLPWFKNSLLPTPRNVENPRGDKAAQDSGFKTGYYKKYAYGGFIDNPNAVNRPRNMNSTTTTTQLQLRALLAGDKEKAKGGSFPILNRG